LIGNLAIRDGRYGDAIKAYEAAHKLAPNGNRTIRLSIAMDRAGDSGGAAKTLETWLDQNPADNDVRLALGVHYVRATRLEDAKTQFTTALDRSPNDLVALNNLAMVQLRLGDLDAAAKHAQAAKNLAGKNPAIDDTLGLVMLERGETARAVRLLGDASDAAPGNAEIAYHFAMALERSGEWQKARDVLRKALASNQPFDELQAAKDLLKKLE
jgi:Flp pilus assembly protein TadD